MKKAKNSLHESFTEVERRASWDEPAETMDEALGLLEAEFGGGKTAVTAKELEISRQLHAQRNLPRAKKPNFSTRISLNVRAV